MKKALTIYLLALALMLGGCGDKLLERSYSTVTPHSAAYRETEDADTLRAENYQDLVNTLLILLSEHSEGGVVRIYGDAPDKAEMAENACVEVQKETPIGAYLLDYITYDGTAESNYYELTVRFGYRRTAEEQGAIVNVTSTEALPDLLRAAIDEDREAVAIRVGYFGTDRNGVLALVSAVHDEVYPPGSEESAETDGAAPEGSIEGEEAAEAAAAVELRPEDDLPEGMEPPDDIPLIPPEPVYDVSPWEVLFYPDNQPEIIEVILGTATE